MLLNDEMVQNLNTPTRSNVLNAGGIALKSNYVQYQCVSTKHQCPLVGGCVDQSSKQSSSGRRRRVVATHAIRQQGKKGWSEADLYDVHVAVDAPRQDSEGLPLYVTIPGGFLVFLACSRILGAFLRSRRANALEERGFKRGGAADEDHYNSAYG